MKLLVTVKRVIDYNVQIRVKPDGSGVEKDNVKMSMNPPDENAVEEALRIKESGKAEEVIILSIGSDKAQETIRTALAMGADRGIHVKTENELEPLAISKIISKIAEEEKISGEFGGDPLVKLKAREIDLKARDNARKEQEGQERLDLDKMRAMMNQENQEAKLQQNEELAGLRAGVSLAKQQMADASKIHDFGRNFKKK